MHTANSAKHFLLRSLTLAVGLLWGLTLFSGARLRASAALFSAPADAQITGTGFYFDTVVTLTLNGTEDQAVIDDCFSLMADYEALLSRTKEGSDIWNINHSGGAPTTVSEETASLIELALIYSDLSDGAFDITIAPVVALWDFQGEEPHSIPNQDLLNEALSHVDYHCIELDGATVTLTDPDASIDLGGIAKGYIADKLREFLLDEGIDSGLINLGGNVLAIGTKPDGAFWKIGIRKPFADASELIAVVSVDDQTVVTSGTYERYFEKYGTIYHHILNPDNGYPIENGLTSVTILADSSARADALSTTCFCLGLERGMELIESLDGIEAMFVTEDMQMHVSSGFPAS